MKSQKVELTEPVNKMVGAKGQRKGECEIIVWYVYIYIDIYVEFQSYKIKRVVGMDDGDGYTVM